MQVLAAGKHVEQHWPPGGLARTHELRQGWMVNATSEAFGVRQERHPLGVAQRQTNAGRRPRRLHEVALAGDLHPERDVAGILLVEPCEDAAASLQDLLRGQACGTTGQLGTRPRQRGSPVVAAGPHTLGCHLTVTSALA